MQKRLYNFSPGPAMLPLEVLRAIEENLYHFAGLAVSPMEIGHRTQQYEELSSETHDLLRDLLDIPKTHAVISMHGGARTQFSAVPMNLAAQNQKTLYIKSGLWSELAYKEAKVCSNAILHRVLRPDYTWQHNNIDNQDACYIHYTPNETVHGIWIPKPESDLPVVADATSTLLGAELDIKSHGIVYAAAQKNMGIAGVTFVIIDKRLIVDDACMSLTPGIMRYANQIESNSLYNTPTTFALFVSNLMFKWVKNQGGIKAVATRNKARSDKLYQALEDSHYYTNLVPKELRSPLNITFNLVDQAIIPKFLAAAHAKGLYALKGHRAVGGIRASVYNGMPDDGIDFLIEFLHEFAHQELACK